MPLRYHRQHALVALCVSTSTTEALRVSISSATQQSAKSPSQQSDASADLATSSHWSLAGLVQEDRLKTEAHLEACYHAELGNDAHLCEQLSSNSSSSAVSPVESTQSAEAMAVKQLEARLPHILEASAWPANATVWSIALSQASKERESLLAAFLGAREWDVERAEEFLTNTLIWRREHDIGADVDVAVKGAVDADMFPHDAIHVVTPKGSDVSSEAQEIYVVIHLGKIGREELHRVDDFVAWRVREQERACLQLGVASKWGRSPRGPKYTLVLDTDGMRPYHLGSDSRAALAKLTHVFTHYYPDFVDETVVVNAPWFVTATWAAVSRFMPDWWGVRLGPMSELEALPGW